MKTNSNKSTHSGECQICGCRQLLPNGVLSLHGYTTKWGFFSGVCGGAKRLPFEVSKDDIAGVVASVEKQIVETEAEIAAWRDRNSERNSGSKAWVRAYQFHAYQWTQVELNVARHQNPGSDYVWHTASYKSADSAVKFPQKVNTPTGSKLETVLDFVSFCNAKYADELARQNGSRRDYVRWQTERLANWTAKPLTPRGSK